MYSEPRRIENLADQLAGLLSRCENAETSDEYFSIASELGGIARSVQDSADDWQHDGNELLVAEEVADKEAAEEGE